MATKKSSRGRKKKRPNYLKFIIIALFCFGAGALTYATLDYFFTKDKVVVKSEVAHELQKKVEKKAAPKKDKSAEKKHDKNAEKTEKNKPAMVVLSDENLTHALADLNLSFDEKKDVKTEEKSQETEVYKPSHNIIKQPSRFSKAKLAIIIDDMADKEHVDGLRSVGLKLTPSFFPPSKDFAHTPNLALKFEFYMVHLPLEAISHKDRLKTLSTKDNYETIEKAIKAVRHDFPRAKFINNHTGSKFTSNLASSKMLLQALKKYDFLFVDSKTIASTKMRTATQQEGFRYIYRDVFLDNKNDRNYIRKELKKAVEIAKKRGYAIAIGHPKKITFKTLKTSQDILSDVEVVYINEIYEYYR
ncbi:divergent polysaccharide deacetylase family protein [Campylobacter geochelonis]|uniref:divergent polysaccharide deacetylase family protein n=1 Tax=Campylobacter geochelonis TaxID=1780362 RepID=UPI0007706E2D|nr:divergent polysaccharide deacetylase family protein [Campylobacter geochelonis]CZE50171.1 polysaccharide deacetylase family protein [Campylobacter geochelonis]